MRSSASTSRSPAAGSAHAPARSTPRSAAPPASVTGWRSPAPPRARRGPISRCWSYSAARAICEARLETGRTHQIRAHFAAIGHPLTGDVTYGGAERYGLERQFLHAHRLAFEHPRSGERLSFRVAAARGPGRRARRGPRRLARRSTISRSKPTPVRQRTGSCLAHRRQVRLAGRESFTQTQGDINARGRPHRAARGRSALRPPDATLEPEHAPLHLRRAGRDPHHRPRSRPRRCWRTPAASPASSPAAAAPCSSSAPRSRRATRSRSGPNAARCPTSTNAGWAVC